MTGANPAKVKFHSNLLGGFGAGLFTPINTIDFGTVFNNIGEKLIDNAHVWGTIIVIVLLYIPFAVLARRTDRNDVFKVNACYKCVTVTYGVHE